MNLQDTTGPVERPIILHPHEVRVILNLPEGEPFMLRRVVKAPPDADYRLRPERWHEDFNSVAAAADSGWIFWTSRAVTGEQIDALAAFTRRAYKEGIPCPYGVKGDVLWGRETWAAISPDEFERPIAACNIEYRADGEWGRFPGQWPPEYATDPERPRWRSPLTMPRWAGRIGLSITYSFPGRLQEMSDTHARLAGFPWVEDFRDQWDAVNKRFSWSLNPWVWTIYVMRAPLPPVARPAVEDSEW